MSDIDPKILMKALLDVTHFKFVEAFCDECRKRLDPNGNAGPRLCFDCNQNSKIEYEKFCSELKSQERPDRKIHVVNLP